MNIIKTSLEGAVIIEPDVFEDKRGFFMETWHQARYRDSSIDCAFVQDNLSFSVRGTLRGLHFQVRRPQAKLVQTITGEIFDVAVDIRRESPTFGKWAGVILSGENRRQFFIPEGFAHGFCVLSETARLFYKCSDFYNPGDEGGILWSDPQIGIEWPVDGPIISDRDSVLPCLAECSPDRLPVAS